MIPTRTCEQCGTQWQTWQHARYCSSICAGKGRERRVYPVTCQRCGKESIGVRPTQRFCSKRCARTPRYDLVRHTLQYPLTTSGQAQQPAKAATPRTWYGCTCEGCGTTFIASTQRPHCSALCGKRASRTRRKAMERGATKLERVYRARVYERDNWCCQLCGEPVDRDPERPTDSMAPSLDHILPLARGGTHTYDNVQLAHFGCNSAKGHRIAA